MFQLQVNSIFQLKFLLSSRNNIQDLGSQASKNVRFTLICTVSGTYVLKPKLLST